MATNLPLFVLGAPGAGKTLVIRGLLTLLTQQKANPAAFKPFDTGVIAKNAAEQPLDGELFAAAMSGEPSINWITPYLAHESYPVEMALRRDGFQVDWRLVNQRQASLAGHYSHLLVETPGALCTPLDEQHQVLDWLVKQEAEVLFLVNFEPGALASRLAEVALLNQAGLSYRLLFNNKDRLTDGDLMFYQWEKLEAAAGSQALGMLATLKEPSPATMANNLAEQAPKLLSSLTSGG